MAMEGVGTVYGPLREIRQVQALPYKLAYSTPYVARAGQMPSLILGGYYTPGGTTIAKGGTTIYHFIRYRLAASAIGLESCMKVVKISEGQFNKVYKTLKA